MLLPRVDGAGAERAAQRLLDAVRSWRYPDVAPALRVTVSVGLVVVDPGPSRRPR